MQIGSFFVRLNAKARRRKENHTLWLKFRRNDNMVENSDLQEIVIAPFFKVPARPLAGFLGFFGSLKPHVIYFGVGILFRIKHKFGIGYFSVG